MTVKRDIESIIKEAAEPLPPLSGKRIQDIELEYKDGAALAKNLRNNPNDFTSQFLLEHVEFVHLSRGKVRTIHNLGRVELVRKYGPLSRPGVPEECQVGLRLMPQRAGARERVVEEGEMSLREHGNAGGCHKMHSGAGTRGADGEARSAKSVAFAGSVDSDARAGVSDSETASSGVGGTGNFASAGLWEGQDYIEKLLCQEEEGGAATLESSDATSQCVTAGRRTDPARSVPASPMRSKSSGGSPRESVGKSVGVRDTGSSLAPVSSSSFSSKDYRRRSATSGSAVSVDDPFDPRIFNSHKLTMELQSANKDRYTRLRNNAENMTAATTDVCSMDLNMSPVIPSPGTKAKSAKSAKSGKSDDSNLTIGIKSAQLPGGAQKFEGRRHSSSVHSNPLSSRKSLDSGFATANGSLESKGSSKSLKRTVSARTSKSGNIGLAVRPKSVQVPQRSKTLSSDQCSEFTVNLSIDDAEFVTGQSEVRTPKSVRSKVASSKSGTTFVTADSSVVSPRSVSRNIGQFQEDSATDTITGQSLVSAQTALYTEGLQKSGRTSRAASSRAGNSVASTATIKSPKNTKTISGRPRTNQDSSSRVSSGVSIDNRPQSESTMYSARTAELHSPAMSSPSAKATSIGKATRTPKTPKKKEKKIKLVSTATSASDSQVINSSKQSPRESDSAVIAEEIAEAMAESYPGGKKNNQPGADTVTLLESNLISFTGDSPVSSLDSRVFRNPNVLSPRTHKGSPLKSGESYSSGSGGFIYEGSESEEIKYQLSPEREAPSDITSELTHISESEESAAVEQGPNVGTPSLEFELGPVSTNSGTNLPIDNEKSVDASPDSQTTCKKLEPTKSRSSTISTKSASLKDLIGQSNERATDAGSKLTLESSFLKGSKRSASELSTKDSRRSSSALSSKHSKISTIGGSLKDSKNSMTGLKSKGSKQSTARSSATSKSLAVDSGVPSSKLSTTSIKTKSSKPSNAESGANASITQTESVNESHGKSTAGTLKPVSPASSLNSEGLASSEKRSGVTVDKISMSFEGDSELSPSSGLCMNTGTGANTSESGNGRLSKKTHSNRLGTSKGHDSVTSGSVKRKVNKLNSMATDEIVGSPLRLVLTKSAERAAATCYGNFNGPNVSTSSLDKFSGDEEVDEKTENVYHSFASGSRKMETVYIPSTSGEEDSRTIKLEDETSPSVAEKPRITERQSRGCHVQPRHPVKHTLKNSLNATVLMDLLALERANGTSTAGLSSEFSESLNLSSRPSIKRPVAASTQVPIKPRVVHFMIHGLGGNVKHFEPLLFMLESLDEKYLAFDLPGFGESDHWHEGYPMMEVVETVKEMLDVMVLNDHPGIKVRFYGHSMGCILLLHLIFRYGIHNLNGDKVILLSPPPPRTLKSKLDLVQPFLHSSLSVMKPFLISALKFFRTNFDQSKGLQSSGIKLFFSNVGNRYRKLTQFYDGVAVSTKSITEYILGWQDLVNGPPRLGGDCTGHVLVGSEDRVTPANSSHYPDYTFRIVVNTGHNMFYDGAAETLWEIYKILHQ